MENINKKYKELVKEIKWRFKESDYKGNDKDIIVIHETIKKDMSFISIYEVKALSNELGISKILELEQDYINKFGEFSKEKTGIDKLRLFLYHYFEQMVYNDDEMRTFLKL